MPDRKLTEIRKLKEIKNQMDLKDIYKTYWPNIKENIFFSAPMEPSLNLTTYSVTKQTSKV